MKINYILIAIIAVCLLVVVFLGGLFYGSRLSSQSKIVKYLKSNSITVNNFEGNIISVNTTATNPYIILNQIKLNSPQLDLQTKYNSQLSIKVKLNKNTIISKIPQRQLPPLPPNSTPSSQLATYQKTTGNLQDLQVGTKIHINSLENLDDLKKDEITAAEITIYIKNNVRGKLNQISTNEISLISEENTYRFSVTPNTLIYNMMEYSPFNLERVQKSKNNIQVLTNEEVNPNRISPALYIEIMDDLPTGL